ncbi:unnamed protein product [Heligmosomoides polygyrus]|uniref:Uncharacterized protein n=1 Tax=Heligmosomoides polygyrus TaxID=6339 RepID=A0A3P8AEC6_HELPZ|nr:unnamed protein product [Heligmosomoides polygyrus]
MLYPCDCSIFKTKAQTALLSLRSDHAQSKLVNKMFELANVASIVLDPFWGDRRKEEVVKDSKHLTVLGLADAIAVHRSSCHKFNSTLRAAAGKRIAVERLDQIPRDYDDSPASPTIIALPLAFLLAEKDLEESDKAKVRVYTTLDGLACQLNQCPITAAIVLVWLDVMPSSHHISHLMCALERHLQCGGTLDEYPPPYEEKRSGT